MLKVFVTTIIIYVLSFICLLLVIFYLPDSGKWHEDARIEAPFMGVLLLSNSAGLFLTPIRFGISSMKPLNRVLLFALFLLLLATFQFFFMGFWFTAFDCINGIR